VKLFSETDAHVNELVREQVACVGSGNFHTCGNHLVNHTLDSGLLHISNG
jgi:hypothetical protein